MGEVLEKTGFSLPNEIITVRYIKRKIGMASGAHIGEDHVISGGMLDGSVRKYSTPRLRNGGLANVLTTEEKNYLENATGLKLSIYEDFWKEHQVDLFKEDNKLDLSNPLDYISYKILSCLKDDICMNWEDRNTKTSYTFVIVKGDEEFNDKKSKFDDKKEAYKLYGKIEDDRDKLLGILKLLSNQAVSPTTPLFWLQGKVGEFIESKPKAFVDLIKDKQIETKLLVQKAQDENIIIKKGNKYSTVDGLDLCENGHIPSFENAIAYLDNPKHQDVRDIIEAKLNKTK